MSWPLESRHGVYLSKAGIIFIYIYNVVILYYIILYYIILYYI